MGGGPAQGAFAADVRVRAQERREGAGEGRDGLGVHGCENRQAEGDPQ